MLCYVQISIALLQWIYQKSFLQNLTNVFLTLALNDETEQVQRFQQLVNDNPNDIVLFNLFEELKDLYNKFRTHTRKKYKDE